MSHVSSVSNSSYAFRGTLSRLDANGDGVLSRGELAADQQPGILEQDSTDDSAVGQQAALSNIIAMLMTSPADGKPSQDLGISVMLPGVTANAVAGATVDPDLQAALDAYRVTYGQYDISSAA